MKIQSDRLPFLMVIVNGMKGKISSVLKCSIVFFVICVLLGCNGHKTHGDPVLTSLSPIYDASTNTFSLTVVADSTDGAKLSFYLMERDKIIQENNDGMFNGIIPFEEGYGVKLRAQWKDTVIERSIHVVDFVVPDESVDKMDADELESLINNHDRSSRRIIANHITQSVKLIVADSKLPAPEMLSDVYTLLVNDVWRSVKVVDLEYNSSNLISSITICPVGEKTE